MIAITGNTYPVKDQIKAMGGKWDAASKSWMVPDDKAEQARALVGASPTKSQHPRTGQPWRGDDADVQLTPARTHRPMPCRKCGSYCYGDCEAS